MPDKKLTTQRSMADFKKAYQAKRKLIERQKDDFLFRLGKQWAADKDKTLREAGINPVVDNRIQPNIFLLTGLERQNRSEFKAFPEGEEDSTRAEIASALLKNSIKVSDFGYKASEAFEDGITCGESHLELYLDNTYNLLNGKPCWKKIDSNRVFPDPSSKEYDYSDARYVFKLTTELSEDELISLYPEHRKAIEKLDGGTIDFEGIMNGDEMHVQRRDYPKHGGSDSGFKKEDEKCFDLLERYYKKWVEKYFLGDKQTGEIKEAEDREKAESFIFSYQEDIRMEQEQFAVMQQQAMMSPEVALGVASPPIPPQPRDPNRFILIKRSVPEIWCFAQIPGLDKPLSDEVAWFYPKWNGYNLVPYYAHFSTAPIDGDDKHLLVQGVVYGVKGVQEKHNSAETLKLMHLNSAQNSGWLSEEDAWVNPQAVRDFGSKPGVDLQYKRGYQKPERQFPMPLSQGHAQIAEESAEAIKAILGINADLLAVQEGGQSSGRAIALRQRQGLLMVQKLFDNLSRTKQICGRLLLSQLGEMYDTETAKKVLGDAFLVKNFPPMMMINEQTGEQEPMMDDKGMPMKYDKELAELSIADVLSGELALYDVAVGESVASETMKLANAAELDALDAKRPGLIPFELLVEESQVNQTTKSRILGAVKQAQAMAVPNPGNTPLPMAG